MSINRIIITGRLTRDPELRTTPSGMAVVGLNIANNRKYRAKGEELREEVTFVEVTCFGNQAKACSENLRKGSQIVVDGRLKMDQWEKDGKKHSKLGIVSESVTFMDGSAQARLAGQQERPTEDPPHTTARSAQPSLPTSPDDDIPF